MEIGCLQAYSIILIPICSSGSQVFLRAFNLSEAYKRALPPPITIPYSTAAFVALRASVILSFTSPTSTSEAPPTFITATPPTSLANLSCSFSLSY